MNEPIELVGRFHDSVTGETTYYKLLTGEIIEPPEPQEELDE